MIFAQESKESNWILKLNATQLVDAVSYPTLQISAERKINPYFSVNAEFGYQLYDFSKADTLLLKSKGFKTNLEGRVYLFKLLNSRIESKRNEFYVGLQLFYRENEAPIYGNNTLSDILEDAKEALNTKTTLVKKLLDELL